MKKYVGIFAAVSLCAVMSLCGCSQNGSAQTTETASAAKEGAVAKNESFKLTKSTDAGNSGNAELQKGDTYAVISVKDYGDIKIKLYPELAPYSVYNFTELAKKGAYNGRNFHRIIEGFMAQGGSANGRGSGGECIDGGNFKNEINTSLRHYYGALCYAASGIGDISDGFYIVNNKQPQNDIRGVYSTVNANYSYYEEGYTSYLESLDKSSDSYSSDSALLSSLIEYNGNAKNASEAMTETITEAVEQTYAEKGGTPSLDGGYTVFGQTVEGFDVIDKITAVEKTLGDDGAVSKPTTEIIIDKIEIFTME